MPEMISPGSCQLWSVWMGDAEVWLRVSLGGWNGLAVAVSGSVY